MYAMQSMTFAMERDSGGAALADDLHILCLDGGGIRGLSSLFILRSIMEGINQDKPPKPCEYFDMIGGTSTGG